MKVFVSEKEVKITELSVVCEGDCGVNKCFFTLPKSFDGLNVTAVFDGVPVPLINCECFIPRLKKGNATLGVYAYKRDGENLELMYSPKSTYFYVEKGSFTDEEVEEAVPEISRFEEFCGMLTSYCEEQIKEHCNLKKTENPKISTLDYGVYSVSGDVFYSDGENGSVNVSSGVLLVLPFGDAHNEKDKSFYLFADNAVAFKGNVQIVGSEARGIAERLPDFVNEINSASSNISYPSARAVYDFVLQEYVENSNRPLSGRVVEKFVEECCSKTFARANENMSNALKGRAEGRVVAVTDASPAPHSASVKLKNAGNLCSLGSIEFENTITLNNDMPISAGQYVFSAVVSSSDNTNDICVVFMMNSKTDYGVKLVLPRSVNNGRVSFPFAISQTVDEFVFYSSDTWSNSQGNSASFSDIKIEKGSEASEYTPYVNLSAVEVSVFGKNLFENFIKDKTYEDGSAITVNSDGSITCDTVDGTYISQVSWIKLPAGTYTISDKVNGASNPYVSAIFYADNDGVLTRLSEINTMYKAFNTITTDKACDVKLVLYSFSTQKNKATLYPQLEVGAAATEYEQYKKPQKYLSPENGTFKVACEYPNTTVLTDTADVNIEFEYNRDVNKAFDELKNAIISLGGNV